MISKIRRASAPFYIQFEITERCNNKCYFCYNPLGHITGNEMSCEKIKDVLKQLSDMGIFRINFNGGEPLARKDFKEIVSYASELGFELHMNTNSTLVNDDMAEFVAKHMKSVCTSILHSDREKHDQMTGRIGAYDDVIRGIQIWRKYGVKVEVNVCTSTENYKDLYNIARLIAQLDCYSLCSTRYILNDSKNKSYLLNSQQTMELIDILMKVREDFPSITDVSLPGPVPYCEVEDSYHRKLKILNVPCQYGYGLARISPVGIVTPCTISDDEMGDLNKNTFKQIWNSSNWEKYESLCHIPKACQVCEEMKLCKGGCVVYDESVNACGEKVLTKKWSE